MSVDFIRTGFDPYARVQVKGLRGEQGLGVHRLPLSFDVATLAHQATGRIHIVEAAAEWRVVGRMSAPSYAGLARPAEGFIRFDLSQGAKPGQFDLAVEMEPRRVQAIENARQGGGLTFQGQLRALVHTDVGTTRHHQDLNYPVNQGVWVQVLAEMGYRRLLLLEVPVPEMDESPELAQASRHLEQAMEAMQGGHYRDAVGACRDVLEAISLALSDHDDQDVEIKALFAGQRTWNKEKRLRTVRRALKVLTHPARHVDQVAAAIDWLPEDARAVLSMTTAVVQVAGVTK